MKLSPLANPVRRHAVRAFTLIELLVVVAIIALLAAGSVGGYGKIMNMVKANAGKKLAVELAGAVSGYYSTYDTLPVTGTTGGGDEELNTLEDTDFLAVLAAKGDVKMNSRKLDFLEGFQQAKARAGSYENGLDFSDEAAPKLYDPWGQEFMVRMDTNHDGEIENPIPGEEPAIIRGKKCLVWSTGRPSSNGTKNEVPSEYLKSW